MTTWTVRPTNDGPEDLARLGPEVRALVDAALAGGGDVDVVRSPHSRNLSVEVSHDAYVAVVYCDPDGSYAEAHLSLDEPVIARDLADVRRYLRLA